MSCTWIDLTLYGTAGAALVFSAGMAFQAWLESRILGSYR